MSEEDRVVANENDGEPFEETARDGSSLPAAPRRARRARVRLVLQRRREPDAVVPPAPPVGSRDRSRSSTTACTTRGPRATSPSTAHSPTPSWTSSIAIRARRSSSTTTTSTSRRASFATRGPRRGSCTSSTSRGREPTTGRCCRSRSGARSTTACSRTTSSASTRAAGAATSCASPRTSSARCPTGRATCSATTDAASPSPRRRSPSTPRSSTTSREAPPCSRRARGSRAGGRRSSILRVDRTDPSKNIVRGFRALELYLDAHPEMHGRVGLLALLDPSRQDIPEYAEYVGAIQREARRVNDRFQQDGWVPIDLQMSDNFPQAVAAYKDFDVLLVNAIFDGLNLVAKEAPLVNERDGVLILSENAGAHEELGDWALSVNPFDVAGQAEAIHRALEMPAEERRGRLEAIRVVGARARPRRLDRGAAAGSRRGRTTVSRVNTLAVEGKLRPVNPATLEPVGVVPVTEDVAHVVAARCGGADVVGAVVVRRAALAAGAGGPGTRRAKGRDRSDGHRRDRQADRRGVHDRVDAGRRAGRVAREERRARARAGADPLRDPVSRAQARHASSTSRSGSSRSSRRGTSRSRSR